MRVDYYDILNCGYDVYCGRPALFAPEGVPEDILARYGFARLYDGRFMYYLDQMEYYHIASCGSTDRVVFDQSTHDKIVQYYWSQYAPTLPVNRSNGGTVMCIISLILLVVSPFLLFKLPTLGMLGWIASLVLMIVVRATYPKNVFGLVLMILHIVAVAVILISALLVMAACYDIMRQCSNL